MSRNPFDDNYRPGASSNMPVKSYTTMRQYSAEDEADCYEREIEKALQESLDSTERSRRHLENSDKIGWNGNHGENAFMRRACSQMPVKSYTTMGQYSAEDEADYYEREIEKTLQETLDSTERSRRHLENSEKIGIATAQELLEQREKLENTEKNLDEIHRTTQMTQRNLNSLKSFFGGFFKNKLSKKPHEPSETTAAVPQSKSASRLSETAASLSTGGSSASFSGPSGKRTLNESSRAAIKGTRWEAMDNQIDENLSMMLANMRNLRRLVQDLGKEADDQNKMLHRIHYKTDRNNAIVRDQDRQMQRILGSDASSSQTTAESLTPSMDTSTKMSFMMKVTSLWK